MVLDTIIDTEVTTTGSRVKVYTLPSGKVAYLKNLIIYNGSSSDAVVEIFSGDSTDDGNYRILTVKVAAGENVILTESMVGGRKAIHDIYVQTDQQPIRVSGALDLK